MYSHIDAFFNNNDKKQQKKEKEMEERIACLTYILISKKVYW